MPVLRLNARPQGLAIHGSAACADGALRRAAAGTGPIIVMIHGYKYLPGHPRHCPHVSIFKSGATHVQCWPRNLGFGGGDPDEGLAIAFGWDARGALWDVAARAVAAGEVLASAIRILSRAAPHRPVHIITHSMGSEVALSALHHLPRGAVARVLALTAASYRSRAEEALATDAGRTAELLNITSGENDIFDAAFECLVRAPQRGDRALGTGLSARNAVTIQIDCHTTLGALSQLAGPIAAPSRRICHWSAYLRPGVLDFYQTAMRAPERLPLATLQHMLPGARTPRFAHLLPLRSRARGLPSANVAAS
ncbi:MAG: alpha/beta hydrolase [Pseudomonadota bacterium]